MKSLSRPFVPLKTSFSPPCRRFTQEAQANIGLEVADKFVRYSDMGDTTSSVNFPNVSIPFTDKSHRLLHIHQNVPGVLSQVNASFADAGINITAQSMMTRGDVGYLVMDVDDNDSAKALERLRSVPQTIKVRVLFDCTILNNPKIKPLVMSGFILSFSA
ncbi:D-3-phosphoglycerate dehydrogenase [Moraxella caprae]|uniref:D-3-phosphoglycerate dehydrogenase n=1 Tax=Moraxella caprae TaxID=90240 RepID=A0A378U4R7_9GAMM|nr:D-3-phosphoglycerate dehydrogenase [Moraxella caprae]